jgi:hypothetical protein
LIGHELGVVLAKGVLKRLETGVGEISACCPIPVSCEKVLCRFYGGIFPFGFGGKSRAFPSGKCVRFVKADVVNAIVEIKFLKTI